MTVRINKPALNLREELTKAQGVVRYEQRQFWMDGLVENGTFDNDISGWDSQLSAVLTYTGSALQVQSTGSNSGATQTFTGDLSKEYIIKATLVSGNGGVSIGGTFFSFTNGELSDTIPAGRSNNKIDLFPSSNTTAVFDNVAVFEVDENDNVIHSVPLGFKPVHVYEDGLLQREGENHDYTVVDTGFGYQVKPTVAPSATTETCIIAEREL